VIIINDLICDIIIINMLRKRERERGEGREGEREREKERKCIFYVFLYQILTYLSLFLCNGTFFIN